MSHYCGDTLDDVMKLSIADILSYDNEIHPTRGRAKELGGVLLEISNPLARISRTETRGKPFSCIGELLWYLSKTSDLAFISYYLAYYQRYQECSREKCYFGGYGPRLFDWKGINQFDNATDILSANKWSRRAVIQILDANDIAGSYGDVPCTCTLQFLVRGDSLNLIASMRSNDVFLGLPHDVFCFTMLQEIMARTLGYEIGIYKHFVGSLHLYERDVSRAQGFLNEGWQATKALMPPMPRGDPWASIERLLSAESQIRCGQTFDCDRLGSLDAYWADLIRLLLVFRAFKGREKSRIVVLKKEMSSSVYDAFIDSKLRSI